MRHNYRAIHNNSIKPADTRMTGNIAILAKNLSTVPATYKNAITGPDTAY